uniref:Uncharacterized protein n=1 Tax=Bracon brevicornis TaxID=1563983 RepID=A0A6V7JJI5_9HYME
MSSVSYRSTEEVAPLASPVFTAPSVGHVEDWGREFERVRRQNDALIEFIQLKVNVHHTIKTNAMETTSRTLEPIDDGSIETAIVPNKAVEQHTAPSLR